MSISSPLPLALLAAGLLLVGCSHDATRSTTATPTRTHTTTSPHTANTASTTAKAADTPDAAPTPDAEEVTDDNQRTGIAACDDYLSSYLACHRAAQIYAPDQLPLRYQAMRTSLLRDARNPDIRPQLGARCNALATQLRQVLRGKPCTPEPATP